MDKKVDSKILLIVLLSMVCLLITGLIYYNVYSMFQMNDEITDIESDIEANNIKINQLLSIQKQEKQIEKVLQQAMEKLPSDPDEAGIIEYLNLIGEGLTIDEISFGSRSQNSIAIEMPIKMSVKGTYESMVAFVTKLADSKRLYVLRDVEMSNASSGTLLQCNFNITTFYK